MTEAEGIPPTASVASVGLGIRYLENWAYAYSGTVGVDDNETTLLSFTTGSGLIVAQIQFNAITVYSTDLKYLVYFNGSIMQGYIILQAADRARADTAIKVVVPPFTIVRCTAQNIQDTSSHDNCVTFTGRVYGAA